MFGIEINIEQASRALTAFLAGLSRRSQEATRAEAEATRARLIDGRYWTHRTGKTAASFRVDQHPERLSAVVVSRSTNAVRLNNGTRPHAIAGSPLRFIAGGRVVFTRRVQHPGTRARHFDAHEAESAEPRLLSRVDAAASEAARSAGVGA